MANGTGGRARPISAADEAALREYTRCTPKPRCDTWGTGGSIAEVELNGVSEPNAVTGPELGGTDLLERTLGVLRHYFGLYCGEVWRGGLGFACRGGRP